MVREEVGECEGWLPDGSLAVDHAIATGVAGLDSAAPCLGLDDGRKGGGLLACPGNLETRGDGFSMTILAQWARACSAGRIAHLARAG
jgi:hypothetical protein